MIHSHKSALTDRCSNISVKIWTDNDKIPLSKAFYTSKNNNYTDSKIRDCDEGCNPVGVDPDPDTNLENNRIRLWPNIIYC